MTKLDWEKSPHWFVRNRTEIWDAIELIETALDEYDEDCGLAFSDIPEKFECVKDFIDKICFPEFHEEKNEIRIGHSNNITLKDISVDE